MGRYPPPRVTSEGSPTDERKFRNRRKKKKKAHHPAGIKPTTSLFRRLCSTTQLSYNHFLRRWRHERWENTEVVELSLSKLDYWKISDGIIRPRAASEAFEAFEADYRRRIIIGENPTSTRGNEKWIFKLHPSLSGATFGSWKSHRAINRPLYGKPLVALISLGWA